MDMKKVLTTMVLAVTLGTGMVSGQQSGRGPQGELVDSASKSVVEVFSDTTAIDSTDSLQIVSYHHAFSRVDRWMERMDEKDIWGMLFVLCVLLILFVLAPVLIIIALFYFITKNRRERIRLAQMAVQQGHPIPDRLLENAANNPDEEYQRGMRQCFVGVGLMIFLGYAAGHVGFGVGALVFCIGLGKVFASRTAQKNHEKDNHLNYNDYDKETDAV